MFDTSTPAGGREPIVNVPGVVVGTVTALVLVQLLRDVGGREIDFFLITRFAFIPGAFLSADPLPYGIGAWWTPVTSFFLHAGWQHLLMNALWLVVFGSAVAWRFGAVRFLVFTLLTASVGSLAHYLGNAQEMVPLIGASGGVSGLTAAAARFVFATGGPLNAFRPEGRAAFLAPAPPLREALAQRTALVFVLVWFAMNAVAAIVGVIELGGEVQRIAWQAHVGGFLAGLLLFPLFDPVGRRGVRVR
jgi:membrane associated rhomboid family serine protease